MQLSLRLLISVLTVLSLSVSSVCSSTLSQRPQDVSHTHLKANKRELRNADYSSSSASQGPKSIQDEGRVASTTTNSDPPPSGEQSRHARRFGRRDPAGSRHHSSSENGIVPLAAAQGGRGVGNGEKRVTHMSEYASLDGKHRSGGSRGSRRLPREEATGNSTKPNTLDVLNQLKERPTSTPIQFPPKALQADDKDKKDKRSMAAQI